METMISGNGLSTILSEGADELQMEGLRNLLIADLGDDTLTVTGDDNTIYSGAYRNLFENITLDGGDDVLVVTGDRNDIYGSGGNDRMTIEGADNWILTGAGTDEVKLKGDDNYIQLQGDGTLTGAGDDNALVMRGAGLASMEGNRNLMMSSATEATLLAVGINNTFDGAGVLMSEGDGAEFYVDSGTTIETTGLSTGWLYVHASTGAFTFNGEEISYDADGFTRATLYVTNDEITAAKGFETDATISGLTAATVDVTSTIVADGITYALSLMDSDWADGHISLVGGAVYGLDDGEYLTIDRAGIMTVNGSVLTVDSGDRVYGFTDWAGVYISSFKNDTLVTGTDGNDFIINYGENVTIDSGLGVDVIGLVVPDREYVSVGANTSVRAELFDYGFEATTDAIIFDGDLTNLSAEFTGVGVLFSMVNGGSILTTDLAQDSVDINIYIYGGLKKVTALKADSEAEYNGLADYYILGSDSTLTGVTGVAAIDDLIISTNGSVDVHYITAGASVIDINGITGDGTITGFGSDDTLKVDGEYSTMLLGDDAVISVGGGTILLAGTADLDSVNINDSTIELDRSGATIGSYLADYALHKVEALGYPSLASDLFGAPTYDYEVTQSVSSETWTIRSGDGLNLSGVHYAPASSTGKWVVLVHGYGDDHGFMLKYADGYLSKGYDVLLTDQRAAGSSGGEWLTMGAAESADVALWTQEIARRVPASKITLHGVSMGAATVMLAAARSDVMNLMAVVEDSGYASAYRLMTDVIEQATEYGEEVMPSLNAAAETLTGFALTEAIPLDAIDDVTVPSMFLHGTGNSLILSTNADSLYEASGALVKQEYLMDGATHARLIDFDSEAYNANLFNFLDNNDGSGAIYNYFDDTIVNGTGGDDLIINRAENVTVNGVGGSDSIVGLKDGDVLIIDGDSVIGALEDGALIISAPDGVSTVQGASGVILQMKGHTVVGDSGLNGLKVDDDGATIVAPDGAVTLDSYTYTIAGDADGVTLSGNTIGGLDEGATLTVGVAGEYIVSGLPRAFEAGDTISNLGDLQGESFTLDGGNLLIGAQEYGTIIATDRPATIDSTSLDLTVVPGANTTMISNAGLTVIDYDPSTRSGFMVDDAFDVGDGIISLGAGNVIKGLDNSARIFDGEGESLAAWTGTDGLLDRSGSTIGEYLIAKADGSTIISGKGRDTIDVRAAGVKVRYGNGRDTIIGFDDDVLYQDAYSDKAVKFTTDGLKFFDDSSSMVLKGVEGTTAVTWQFGDETLNAVYIADGEDYAVDELADEYIGMTRNTGVDFSNIEDIYIYNMLERIGRVTLGGGASTFEGTDGKETITAGAGDDVIVLSKGRDLIYGFDAETDKLIANDDFSVKVKGNDVLISADGEQALLIDLATVDGALNINDRAVKAGAAMSFDGGVNAYVGSKNATLNVEGDANIWLGGFDGVNYTNIKTVDASDSDGDVLIAGSDKSDLLIGGYGSNSLWGGVGGRDTLIGGDGSNEFFYGLGNGLDVIEGADNDDVVNLLGVSLDDIKAIDADDNSVTMKFTDGGRLNINSTADLTYSINGADYALNRNAKTLQRK